MRWRIYPWLMVAMYMFIVPKAVGDALMFRGYVAYGGEWLLPALVVLVIELCHMVVSIFKEIAKEMMKEWEK